MFCSSQEKKTGALLFVLKETETGALQLMFAGEGDWRFTVFERKAMGMYCTLENGSGAVPSLLAKGGGGGGGFTPDFCENTILRYELAMMARTCEALEQKWGPKTKI